jgi:1-pyrroline-5-carboxylate dehydrogenase
MKSRITYTSLFSDETIHSPYEAALNDAEDSLGQHHPMIINGYKNRNAGWYEACSPLDKDILLGYFQNGRSSDARDAFREASLHQPVWEELGWEKRVRIIRNTADLMEEDLFHLAAVITLESGKSRFEAIAEVSESIDLLRYYAAVYEQNSGYEIPMKSPLAGEECQSILRPYGVFAVISPFNFPLALATGMAGGALICGNSVVVKPSRLTPLSLFNLSGLFSSAGLPEGVFSLITGPGEEFGISAITDPDVSGIAFTGSRTAGMELYRGMAEKSSFPKPVIVEMGSKNPCIVTSHADIEQAAEGIVRAAFGFSGQKCSATSRVYVERGVAARFLQALKGGVSRIVVGDPRDRATFNGPVINRMAYEVYQRAVTDCRSAGGSVETGGFRLEGGLFDRGYYLTPVIATNVPSTHPLFHDELFVPFLLVKTVNSLDEAIRMANTSEYGLCAGIFSTDPEEVDLFFREIRSGVCYANRSGGATTGAWPGAQPFGGWKASGTTGKGAGGPYYLLSFVREQSRTRVRG